MPTTSAPVPRLLSRFRCFAVVSILAILALGILPTPCQAEHETARDQWMSGYEKLEEARKAEDAGKRELAVSLYSSALDVFSAVKTEHPDWNPGLLRYRIRFCRDRIEALRKSLDVAVTTLTRNELLEVRDKQKDRIAQLETELRGKQRELDIASQAVERARREAARNAAAREQTEDLLTERRKLTNQVALLSEKATALERELEESKKGFSRDRQRVRMLEDRLSVLEAENKRAAESVVETRALAADLETKIGQMGAEREKLRAEAIRSEATLSEARTVSQRQEEEIAKLSRQLADQREALAMANQRKAAADARAEASSERVAALDKQVLQLEAALRETAQKQGVAAEAEKRIENLTRLLKQKDEELSARAATIRKLNGESETRDQQLARLKALARSHSDDRERLQKKLVRLEKAEAESKTRIAELEARIEGSGEGRREIEQRINTYRERLERAEQDRDRISRQSESRLALLRQQEQEIRQLRDNVEKMKQAAAEPPDESVLPAGAATLQKRLADALTESEYHRQLAEEARRTLAVANKRIEALSAKVEEPATQAAAEIASLTRRIEEIRADLDSQRRRADSLEKRLLAQPSTPAADSRADVPDLVTALLHKGVEAEKNGKSEAATWNYKQVLEHDPANVLALRRLGALAVASGNDKDAVDYLSKAFYADPDHEQTLQQLGFALVREEKPDMALSMLSRAVALDQEDPEVHKQLGVACSSLGWKQAAEVQFRRALKLDTDNSDTAFNLAVLLASQGDARMKEAREFYRKARQAGAAADPRLDTFFNYQDE